MKFTFKRTAAAGALLALSSTAFADLTQSQINTAQSGATLTNAQPTGATAFSSLIFFAYNIDGSFSQVQTLGIRGSNSTSTSASVFSNTQTNDLGTVLNFSLDNAAGLGSNASTLRWGILSFDDAGTPDVAPAAVNLLATVNSTSVVSGGSAVAPNTQGIIGTGTGVRNFLNNNPSASSDSVISTTAGALDNWTTNNLNTATLTSTIGAAAAASSTLAMYMFSSVQDANTGAFATSAAYAGTWALNALTGTLTYSVEGAPQVPVPAAVWLLLSGLGGLGVVGRRRQNALAAA